MGILMHQHRACHFLSIFLTFFLLGNISTAAAGNLTKARMQAILDQSLKNLLTGQPFSPELEKKQVVIRKMFDAGLITKAECVDMVEKAMLPTLKNSRTSRYILKEEGRNYEAKTLEAFQAKCGMTPVPLSPSDRQLLEQAADRVNEKLAGKLYSRELMNDIQQALAELRAEKQ
ncbi:MAG: hypothetical protein SWH68_12800 [Thermodesulfobacteriota bacterium]|nr:hypothetical protein [Thermodesulfobacteriota bacterium]